MRKIKYIRKGHMISDIANMTSKRYGSINKAKKASRDLQIGEDGMLGKGSVAVDS